MDKNRSHTTESILNITLKIIYLLTGEDYTVVKKTSGDHLTPLSCASITVSPLHSMKHDRDNDQKILELTDKIIQLLTGQEGEYIEEHRGLYKDEMMENHRPLTLWDGTSNRDTPERCPHPLYSQDCTEENRRTPQEYQVEGLTYIKVEVTEDEEETYMKGVRQCKEEEIPIDISTDGQRDRNTSEGHLTLFPDFKSEKNKTEDSAGENPISPIMHPEHHCADVSSDPSDNEECSINSDVGTHSADPTDATVFPSSECFKSFNNQSAFIRQKCKYKCSECGKCFTQKSNFVIHERSHTGERPFSCSDCGKCFTQKSYLVRHQRSHTGESPFLCNECGKCFTQKSNLVTHLKHHTDKPFLCTECVKCFTYKSDLVAHQRMHTGEKPFKCSQCGKCFTRKSNLVIHQRNHTGERPYACFRCEKCFTQKSALHIHQRIHTGERPFPCSECEKTFTQKSNLDKHLRRTHK
ncbi:oocyte zinc finger protein XlCOF8.4-like isoform X2 [Pseudophryne corroboree]|uniref:oocyte zinc finger protein XlCOF8.4-like isoform X2 n=1 Tax=Pseudophryne corroboree TaxID=495146 RepID=UPI003081CB67